MKSLFVLVVSAILQSVLSCNNVDIGRESKNISNYANSPGSEPDRRFDIDTEDILKDYMTWYTYTGYNINLGQDFIGLNRDSSILDKPAFLDVLSTGKFIPIKVMIHKNLPVLKLYIVNNSSPDIQNTIRQMALIEISHVKMEGGILPDYNFTDLNSKVYDKSTTKGKILVIKCWFIHCMACVKEFPELNQLVDEYKGRKDILFISLAIDNKKDLIPFLKKKSFKYAVVPGKQKFMEDTIGINAYPTHILINKTGEIKKVSNSIKDLIPFLQKEALHKPFLPEHSPLDQFP